MLMRQKLHCFSSIDEAVDRYYEDPDRYSDRRLSSMANSIAVSISSSVWSSNRNQATAITVSTEPTSYSLATRIPPTSAGSKTSPRQPFATASTTSSSVTRCPHENALLKAAKVRAQDELEMQNMRRSVQLSCRIYNPEIEPEHETHLLCDCPVHKYWKKRFERLGVLEMWSKAVMYSGEKSYHGFSHLRFSNNNPYTKIMSPYTLANSSLYGIAKPDAQYHINFLQQTITLDSALNETAQAAIQTAEPSFNIWELEQLESLMSDMSLTRLEPDDGDPNSGKSSKRSTFRRVFFVRSSDERAALKIKKKLAGSFKLRSEIIQEEQARWQDEVDRNLVSSYQEQMGIAQSVVALRTHKPIQYLHLLRAGYLEPIPITWQGQTSNPLRFSIDSSAGWRGLTPAWRGYKNTAEERLYWTLRHRLGGEETIKEDLISELDMARERMALAVHLHPRYNSINDICHDHHPSESYSKQIKPPFRRYPDIKSPTDETIILLDARGSMDVIPLHPNYKKYLITGYSKSNQPKNQELAKAVIRRFVEALGKYESNAHGYYLATFSNQAEYIDMLNGSNLNAVWSGITFAGLSHIMVGWQKIKEMHFQKHSETATYHPVYGWQAGPQTPKLRVLLILGGEYNDLDEFELTFLHESWAYIAIFLMGVEGCLHHHRRAKRLQRMANSNPRLSIVEAQGLVPERFVAHELLKCHLGREISMSEFEDLEQQPAELPSPLGPLAQRSQLGQNQLEQLLIELPSADETGVWQGHSQIPTMPGLYELPDDQRPAELPATESSAVVPQVVVPTWPG